MHRLPPLDDGDDHTRLVLVYVVIVLLTFVALLVADRYGALRWIGAGPGSESAGPGLLGP